MIIDIHTHTFPDDLACRAVPTLAKRAGLVPFTDGTCRCLKENMKNESVDISLVLPIATKESHTETINKWALDIQSNDNIISFGTIHPDYKKWDEEITWLKKNGFKGIKLHPDYQDFFVDEDRMFPLYEKIFNNNLIVLFHAGIDIGLPKICHCPPDRLKNVYDTFPNSTIIAAHMGGFQCTEDVEKYLIGTHIFLDTSYSVNDLEPKKMERLIKSHGADKILFGSDSPWGSQKQSIEYIQNLKLSKDEIDAILGGNAKKLLDI